MAAEAEAEEEAPASPGVAPPSEGSSESSKAPTGKIPPKPWPVYFPVPRSWEEWGNWRYEEAELWHAAKQRWKRARVE